MSEIRIDVGVYTPLTVNLTAFDFTGVSKVVFTVKNSASVNAPAVITREYTAAQSYDEIVTPQESLLLLDGAVYDVDVVTADGKQYKLTENGAIALRRGVGDCIE